MAKGGRLDATLTKLLAIYNIIYHTMESKIVSILFKERNAIPSGIVESTQSYTIGSAQVVFEGRIEPMHIQNNDAMRALLETQKAFEGVVGELGLKDEQDIVDMIKQIRSQRTDDLQCE